MLRPAGRWLVDFVCLTVDTRSGKAEVRLAMWVDGMRSKGNEGQAPALQNISKYALAAD